MNRIEVGWWRAGMWIAAALLLLAVVPGCGDDGNDGNGDTLLTGFSGFVIICVVGYFIFRAMAKRGK